MAIITNFWKVLLFAIVVLCGLIVFLYNKELPSFFVNIHQQYAYAYRYDEGEDSTKKSASASTSSTGNSLSIEKASDGAPLPSVLLLTANLCSDNSGPHCSNETLKALQAWTSCAARGLGMAGGRHRVESDRDYPLQNRSSWPYPHYVKIDALEKNMKQSPGESLDWIMWVDADTRIVRLTDQHLFRQLLSSDDIHLIVAPVRGYSELLNNVFLVRNSNIGRLFVQHWKELILGDDDGSSSCGSYDQCPFIVAMIQMIQNAKKESNNNTTDIDPNLTDLAWNKGTTESTLVKELLHQLVCAVDGNNKTCTFSKPVPKRVGPVMMIPAWHYAAPLDEHGNNHTASIPSFPLSIYPDRDFEFIMRLSNDTTSRWPLVLHSKYNTAFCQRRNRIMSGTLKQKFVNLLQLDQVCTRAEIDAIANQDAACWVKVP